MQLHKVAEDKLLSIIILITDAKLYVHTTYAPASCVVLVRHEVNLAPLHASNKGAKGESAESTN